MMSVQVGARKMQVAKLLPYCRPLPFFCFVIPEEFFKKIQNVFDDILCSKYKMQSYLLILIILFLFQKKLWTFLLMASSLSNIHKNNQSQITLVVILMISTLEPAAAIKNMLVIGLINQQC